MSRRFTRARRALRYMPLSQLLGYIGLAVLAVVLLAALVYMELQPGDGLWEWFINFDLERPPGAH